MDQVVIHDQAVKNSYLIESIEMVTKLKELPHKNVKVYIISKVTAMYKINNKIHAALKEQCWQKSLCD